VRNGKGAVYRERVPRSAGVSRLLAGRKARPFQHVFGLESQRTDDLAVCTEHEPSDPELRVAHENLLRWQTPQEFISNVEAFEPLVKSSTLFNKTNAGFLREAIPIAELARHRDMQSVRMVKQREGLNDGQFRSAGETIDIEVTEVMEPDRRRGEEYRCGTEEQRVCDFDPNLGETIANELAKGVKKKADKGYPNKPLLLVYLNIGPGGRIGNEVESAIARLRTEYTDTFREICVLWGTRWC
jgi:hypothetical protein